jgi:hypothetical protein
MKLLACLPLLLLAAASAPLSAPAFDPVPLGKFQTWRPTAGPLTFAADGARVTVEARACTAEEKGSDACELGEGMYNSAMVTIERDGCPAFRAEVNNAGSSYRVALVRLDRDDTQPALIVESDPGGSGGGVVETVFAPLWKDGPYKPIVLDYAGMGFPWGDRARDFSAYIADYPRDLNGDGHIDFVLADGKFAGSPFGCHACERQPPLILSLGASGAVDVSRDPAFRPLFEKALAEHRAECVSGDGDHAPACAAWVADAARLGRFEAAWKEMLPHLKPGELAWQDCLVASWPCPAGRGTQYRSFPESLRAFLKKAGYIS